jgi:hypothetical protein
MSVIRWVEIWATVFRTQVALRFWPERELAFALREDAASDEMASQALVREFQRATRSIAPGRCLLRSVACVRFLRRRGLAASLRVGFAPEFHGGHAWVDCEGEYSSRFRVFNLSAAGLAAWIANRRTI